jgi:CHAT domain-containing protein
VDTVRLGSELWNRLLSDEIRDHLTRHPDQRLVVLGNDIANGLPWELLAAPRGTSKAAPLQARSIVRRVALQGASRLPAGRLDRARLCVLLIANPTGNLPHAALEADEVEHLLKSRPDVSVVRLDGASATVAAVTSHLRNGDYDVLHYAGHASFHEDDPSRGGLQLADGILTAEGVSERPPRLVYLSACWTGRTRDIEADVPPPPRPHPPRGNGRSLAEAFLRIGTSALIGTFFMVDDGNARRFASAVHTELAAGRTLGTAVSEARRQLYRERIADWANFLLYGDDGMIL